MRGKSFLWVVVGVLLVGRFVAAQSPPPPPPAPPTPAPPPPPAESADDGLTVRGTSVGYIDTAAVGNQVLLRSDFGYRFAFPNRAEFFYAQGRPGGPGLPRPERQLDYQDVTVYAERTVGGRASVFLGTGARFLNPEVNANTAGLSDSNVGFKYALLTGDDRLATFQFRTYVPTGDSNHGSGTGHVSLEPGLLGYSQLTDRLGLAGELRYWIPVGGTDFAGSVVRYGLGLRYALWECGDVRVSPTAEAIGWTVLSGRESRLAEDGTVPVQSAAGATVVNLKLGVRLDAGPRLGFYTGYGRAVTGEKWYADILRLEMRWLY